MAPAWGVKGGLPVEAGAGAGAGGAPPAAGRCASAAVAAIEFNAAIARITNAGAVRVRRLHKAMVSDLRLSAVVGKHHQWC